MKSLTNVIKFFGKGNSVSPLSCKVIQVFKKISAPSLRFGQYFFQKPCRTGHGIEKAKNFNHVRKDINL
jgi:hypothetical protein